MKYTINTDLCIKNGLDLDELLGIMLVKLGVEPQHLIDKLLFRQVLVRSEGKLFVTQRWDDVATTILLDSDPSSPPIDLTDKLAEELMEIFPVGKKNGTNMYWRGNKREISLRLKKFFKLYGNTYTTEAIKKATTKYVEGFNGNYQFMRLLKYFIWKDERKLMEDGEVKVIETSELCNYLENSNQENTLSNDWTSNLN